MHAFQAIGIAGAIARCHQFLVHLQGSVDMRASRSVCKIARSVYTSNQQVLQNCTQQHPNRTIFKQQLPSPILIAPIG